MRLGATKASATSSYNGLGNQLYDLGGARPSLDLDFAGNKTLRDNISTKNLIDFTRQSSGTYVGSDGLIKTATTNLLLQSEDFSTTWSRVNVLAFGSGSIVNNAVAPDGSTTADKITPDTSNNQHRIDQTPSSTAGAQVFTVYVKAAGYSFVGLRIGFNGAGFNLSTGAIASLVTATSASITPVGNGWYRCSVYESSAAANAVTRINVTTENQSLSAVFEGDGTSGIYIWGAQLEQSSTVGEYVKTTSTINSAPRFDHNPTTGESLGLLVEESRTNLLLQSEEFDSVSWTTSAATITANTGTSPAGTTTVDTIASTGTAVVSQAITKAASTVTYSGSLFVKGTVTALSLTIDDGATVNRGRVVFNLSTGAISSTNNDGSFSATTGTITPFPNDWYRVTITTTTNSSTTTARLRFFWTGSGTSIDVWGAQLEAGSFPTSYIPTTTAAVTRSADVASITGTNFSSWYKQSEGTVFSEASAIGLKSSGAQYQISIGTSSTNEIRNRFVNAFAAAQIHSSAGETFAYLSAATASTNYKTALAYKSNDSTAAINSVSSATDTGVTLPTAPSSAYLGHDTASNNQLNGTIRRLTYWPSRLPNSTLQTITQ